MFSECGEVRDVEMRQGYAFVKMADLRSAKRVLGFDGHKIMPHKQLKVRFKE